MKPTIKQQKKALEESIRHWREDYKPNFEAEDPDMLFDSIFNAYNCSLCQLHDAEFRYYNHEDYCGTCPLSDGRSGCGYGSTFEKAANSIHDKPLFMIYRRRLISRMKRALDRLNKKEKSK